MATLPRPACVLAIDDEQRGLLLRALDSLRIAPLDPSNPADRITAARQQARVQDLRNIIHLGGNA